MLSAAYLVGAAQTLRRDGLDWQEIRHRILAIVVRHGLRAEVDDGAGDAYAIRISNGLTFGHAARGGYSCGH